MGVNERENLFFPLFLGSVALFFHELTVSLCQLHHQRLKALLIGKHIQRNGVYTVHSRCAIRIRWRNEVFWGLSFSYFLCQLFHRLFTALKEVLIAFAESVQGELFIQEGFAIPAATAMT